jgi:hypothetical protein
MGLGGVSNKNVFSEFRTFQTTLTSADVGKAVTMTGNNTVGLGADGDTFVGVLERVEKDGIARVRCFGNVKVPYSGTVAVGNRVVVDGAGKVKAVTTQVNGRGFVSVVDAAAGTVEVEL